MDLECESCGEVLDIEVTVTVTRIKENLGRFRVEGVAPACPECGEWRWHLTGDAGEGV